MSHRKRHTRPERSAAVRPDPRLVRVPDAHRQYVVDALRDHGIPGAMRITRLGRVALLGIAARGECMAGTAALLREHLGSRVA